MSARSSIAACLWYDGAAEAAARFYVETFPDARIKAIHRAPGDYPAGHAGDVLTVEFMIAGMAFLGLNGGSGPLPTEAVSFQIYTDDQAQTDRLWEAITSHGGRAGQCSWCRDRWGISWQIVPRMLMDALSLPDRAAAQRAFAAMMTMTKIDIAAIKAAVRGDDG